MGVAIVGGEVAGLYGRRHAFLFDAGHGRRQAGEGVEAADGYRPEQRQLADVDPERNLRSRERRGVEEHKPLDPLRMAQGIAHADGPAPIMQEERHALQFERIEQGFQVGDVLIEGIGIVLRLVGEPATHMIGGDDAMPVAELGDQVSVIEGPGRIAVQHDKRVGRLSFDRLRRAFIHIVVVVTGERQVMGFERVEVPEGFVHSRAGPYQVTPSIMQLRPLPMPISASFSARVTWAASMLRAMVMGRDTDPMLPRNSTVGKSIAGSSFKVSNSSLRCAMPTWWQKVLLTSASLQPSSFLKSSQVKPASAQPRCRSSSDCVDISGRLSAAKPMSALPRQRSF